MLSPSAGAPERTPQCIVGLAPLASAVWSSSLQQLHSRWDVWWGGFGLLAYCISALDSPWWGVSSLWSIVPFGLQREARYTWGAFGSEWKSSGKSSILLLPLYFQTNGYYCEGQDKKQFSSRKVTWGQGLTLFICTFCRHVCVNWLTYQSTTLITVHVNAFTTGKLIRLLYGICFGDVASLKASIYFVEQAIVFNLSVLI